MRIFGLNLLELFYCRRNLPVDLAEGVLRALCLQALGQVITLSGGSLADEQQGCFIFRLHVNGWINYLRVV